MKTDRIRDEDVPHITIAENEARHAEKHLFNGVKLAHRPRLLLHRQSVAASRAMQTIEYILCP